MRTDEDKVDVMCVCGFVLSSELHPNSALAVFRNVTICFNTNTICITIHGW